MFTDQTIGAFVVAIATVIDGADLHNLIIAIGLTVASDTGAVYARFAIGATMTTLAAVVERTSGIVSIINAKCFAEAFAVAASQASVAWGAAGAAVVGVGGDIYARAIAVGTAFDFFAGDTGVFHEHEPGFAGRSDALAVDAVHFFGIFGFIFVGITTVAAFAAMIDVVGCVDAFISASRERGIAFSDARAVCAHFIAVIAIDAVIATAGVCVEFTFTRRGNVMVAIGAG